MVSQLRVGISGSVVVWAAVLAFSAASAHVPPAQKTTNDGVYTKAQADGAKKQFDKICADCHPFTVAAKKKPADLPLGDEPFFESWSGRPLSEMVTLIALTMPNDGSATVTDEEALNLVAYILQQNGYPAGSTTLTKATAPAVIERPKPQGKHRRNTEGT
jgi:mono/diheme cytochrome c family protein